MKEADSKSSKKSKLSTRLGFILLVFIAIWLFTVLTTDPLLPVGTEAPSWRLQLAGRNGETLDQAQLKGEVVVLDFWSWGCPTCIEEA